MKIAAGYASKPMEEIIKKAVEGGYDDKKHDGAFVDQNKAFCFVICDPLFWQALGKACRWETNKPEKCFFCYKDYPTTPRNTYTEQKALEFHEINLTEGWDKAISYLRRKMEVYLK